MATSPTNPPILGCGSLSWSKVDRGGTGDPTRGLALVPGSWGPQTLLSRFIRGANGAPADELLPNCRGALLAWGLIFSSTSGPPTPHILLEVVAPYSQLFTLESASALQKRLKSSPLFIWGQPCRSEIELEAPPLNSPRLPMFPKVSLALGGGLWAAGHFPLGTGGEGSWLGNSGHGDPPPDSSPLLL